MKLRTSSGAAFVSLGDPRVWGTPLHSPPESARRERAQLRAARAGSLEAFEQLFRAHWPRAYRAALLVVHDAAAAEDIAQEAFLAAVRALDRSEEHTSEL